MRNIYIFSAVLFGCLAIAGAFFFIRNVQRIEEGKAQYEREERERQAVDKTGQDQLKTALRSLKPGLDRTADNWPELSDAACPSEVKGQIATFHFNQLREWANETGTLSDAAKMSGIVEASTQPFIGLYLITQERPMEMLGDGKMVPGFIEGRLAVFDRAAFNVLCQAAAKAGGSSEIHASVTQVKKNGATKTYGDINENLRQAGKDDLRFALTHALGAAISPLAPQAFFGVQFE